MKPIILLTDEDIFPKNFIHKKEWKEFTERVAVKVIVFDNEGKIALCGTKYKLLPGGGVDAGESLEEAGRRECFEEIGCNIQIEKNIGYSEEVRESGKRHQFTHCLVAKIIGEKGEPQSIQEDEKNMKIYWHSLEDTLRILNEQVHSIPFESYNSCFNVRTHLAFLNKFISLKI